MITIPSEDVKALIAAIVMIAIFAGATYNCTGQTMRTGKTVTADLYRTPTCDTLPSTRYIFATNGTWYTVMYGSPNNWNYLHRMTLRPDSVQPTPYDKPNVKDTFLDKCQAAKLAWDHYKETRVAQATEDSVALRTKGFHIIKPE